MSFGLEGRGKPFGNVNSLGFQIDYRIGGKVTGVLGGQKLTLFPDEIRKCVAFACVRTLTKTVPVGTAFFVAVPSSGGGNFFYVVTARHVVEGVKEHATDGCLYLRVNLRIGATFEIKTNVNDWVFHPTNKSVDVAVLMFGLPPEVRDKFDFRVLPIGMCATDEIIAKEAIGIGDSVFLTGLFTAHSGTKRNIPIVRVGNIAAMPEEPVKTMFGDAEVYLVEARSIGGLSGSPVFVHLGLIRVSAEGTAVFSPDDKGLRTTSGPFYLLGLMHGHWDWESHDEDSMVRDWRNESVNLGIAIVVPVTKILEVINQPLLEERRKAIEDDLLRRSPPKPDGS